MSGFHVRGFILAFVVLCSAGIGIHGQTGALKGEWHSYGGDAGHTRYAPLDQINAQNFSTLTVAWRRAASATMGSST